MMTNPIELTEGYTKVAVCAAMDPSSDQWMVIGPYWEDGSPDANHFAPTFMFETREEAMELAKELAPSGVIKVYERPATSAAQSAPRPAADPANTDEDDPAHHTGMLVTATVSLEPGSERWLVVGPYWGPDGNDAMVEAPSIFIDGDEKAMAYAKELASNVEGGCRLNVYGRPAPKPSET
jgi:hypothetical protein